MFDTEKDRQYGQGRLLAFGLILGITGFVGCSAAESEPTTGAIQVTVTYDGKPVTKGSVQLIKVGTAQSAGGELNDAGMATIEGVQVGSYAVSILPPDPPIPNPDAPPAPPVVYVNIPQKYRGETTSPLKADVKEGSNEFTFELK